MPVRYEKPTITKENVLRDGDKTYSHPAYGVIGLCASTWNPSQHMFGSHVKHSNIITLRIKTAERTSNGDYEFIHGKKDLIEVMLTGTQLGDLLTSMNRGDGVPCTIRRTETDWDIPLIENEETPISESRKSMDEHITKVMEKADRMIKETQALLKDKKSANKGELTKISDQLAMVRQEIYSNLPFVAKCFDEKIEKTISHAKGEVDAFVSNTIRSAGLEAISKGQYKVEIPYHESEVIEIGDTNEEN